MRSFKRIPAVEMWAAPVWLAVGAVALLLPLLFATPQANALAAVAEVALNGPMAVWLAWLTARAFAAGRWETTGRAVLAEGEALTFWCYAGVAVLIAGAFLAGFVRALLSLAAYL